MKRFIFRCLQYTLTLALLGVRSKNERVYAGSTITLYFDPGASGVSPEPTRGCKGESYGVDSPLIFSRSDPPFVFFERPPL